jgi:phytoene synthase
MPDAFAHCEALVRAADRERFLTALFAPAEYRMALFALYAFNIEIARVREVVRDPLAGDADANPVVSALTATVTRFHLPVETLRAVVAARRFDLYDEPMATLGELEAYADGASGGLIRLAARILANGEELDIAPIAHHAGIAHAIAGLLAALPVHAARGQIYIPQEILERHGAGAADVELRAIASDHLAKAGRLLGAVPPELLPALLPVALVPTMLARMVRAEPFEPKELSPWRRQWLIWRAARRPRRILGC